jgi:hypothetical protein
MSFRQPVERTVRVHGELRKIIVYQKSKSIWVAVGDYMGKPLEVKDRSASSAEKAWADAARFRGN